MRRLLTPVLVLAVVAGVGWYFLRDGGPLPVRERCTATVGSTTVRLDPEQARNATLVAAIGVRRGLPARAVSIALATAYQESKIRNLDHGDRDSLGVFQQRPSQGWGTPAQVRDVAYATNAFYDALAKVEGYRTMRITEAAQKVQRSGFPEAYEPHAADARALASALTGYSADGAFTCRVRTAGGGSLVETRTDLEAAFGSLDTSVTRGVLVVRPGGGVEGQRRGWAAAQYLVAHASRLGLTSVSYDGLTWRAADSSDGWTSGSKATGLRVT